MRALSGLRAAMRTSRVSCVAAIQRGQPCWMPVQSCLVEKLRRRGAGSDMMREGSPKPRRMEMGARVSLRGEVVTRWCGLGSMTVGDAQRWTANQMGATQAKPTMATARPNMVVLSLIREGMWK